MEMRFGKSESVSKVQGMKLNYDQDITKTLLAKIKSLFKIKYFYITQEFFQHAAYTFRSQRNNQRTRSDRLCEKSQTLVSMLKKPTRYKTLVSTFAKKNTSLCKTQSIPTKRSFPLFPQPSTIQKNPAPKNPIFNPDPSIHPSIIGFDPCGLVGAGGI